MVVVSGSWVKNVATYPTPANNDDMVIPTTNIMSAKAVLICRPNSHPFQERTLTLDQPVKVGRSVARARASATNAIFDCKVLSRHHAVLWFDNGKFYLQDTKSSNGTFVNNNKLSSSDSEPHEVCSGDIVQFGVDVVENNRKVTHCCIVATLKLYLADGKEARPNPSITESNRHGLVPLDDLYKLNQIIQEACQREQCLENKLSALQQLVEDTKQSSEESWQAYVGEERLLSRVATLENQLVQVSKSSGDDQIRSELHKLQEDQTVYQNAAKEALLKLHREMLDATAIATKQEQARKTAEQEAVLAKDQLSVVQEELQELAHRIMLDQQKLLEEKSQIEQRERELKAKLESESQTVFELKMRLEQYVSLVPNPVKELLPLKELEKCSLIYTDDTKFKEDMLAEDCENSDGDYNNSNNWSEPENNHINLRIGAVSDECDNESDSTFDNQHSMTVISDRQRLVDFTLVSQESSTDHCTDDMENEKELKSVSKVAKYDKDDLQEDSTDDEKDDEVFESRKTNTKTLKYHYQSLQNEYKSQMEYLRHELDASRKKITDLEHSLMEERESNTIKDADCKVLTESGGVCRRLKNNSLIPQTSESDVVISSDELEMFCPGIDTISAPSTSVCVVKANGRDSAELYISNVQPHLEKVASLEEELVVLKERFSVVNEEKLALSKSLLTLNNQYKSLSNRSYNTIFFYFAPLVLMVLYLLICQYFS